MLVSFSPPSQPSSHFLPTFRPYLSSSSTPPYPPPIPPPSHTITTSPFVSPLTSPLDTAVGQIPIDLYAGLERPLKALGITVTSPAPLLLASLAGNSITGFSNGLDGLVTTPPNEPIHWSQQLQSGGTWKPANCISRQVGRDWSLYRGGNEVG